MRTGLTTIQQTMTTEAASVLACAVAEAARRRHGQTTPLHVAATLLGAPSGLLRRACMSSHPDSAHPLQCRALELCFSVALDRLSSSSPAVAEPPMSNALKAALKRAQASQRRGGPEQPQQPSPLLAVKVELEQFLISILDDPSVSRVMREASFSSTAVKAVVEQSLSSSSSSTATITIAGVSASSSPASPALSFPSSASALGINLSTRAASARKLSVNPRLHQHQPNGGGAERPRTEEVKRVMDILLRSRKRNPVLVGDSDQDAIMKEVLQKIESGDAPRPLHSTKVVSFGKELATAAATGDPSWIPARIRELSSFIESEMTGDHGVVLDLGDLKWLVEITGRATTKLAGIQRQPVVCEAGRAAVAEMGRLLRLFEARGRVWLVGTATCTMYLRCQVYHPTMENDWDLQAVQVAIASRPLLSPRLGVNGNLSCSIESRALTGGFSPLGATSTPRIRPPDGINSLTRTKEIESSSSKVEGSKALPRWLQLAKLGTGAGTKSSIDHPQAKEQELQQKQSTEELSKEWQETCSMPEPKLTVSRNLSSHHLPSNQENIMLNASGEQPSSPPGSPVKTDLVLGNSRASNSSWEEAQSAKFAGISDTDSLKRLIKGLVDKVSWQQQAASAIAAAVMQCKSEHRKRPSGGAKRETWLLFVGPDKVGKRKMAVALSELVFGASPTIVSFGGSSCPSGDYGESNVSSRGRTSMDRVVEAVRRNPFSMIVLEDIDRADGVVRGSIKRAMEQGRLLDSCGREVGLGSVVFVLTSSWLPEELKRCHDSLIQCEEKVLESAVHGWQLELSAEMNPRKRSVDWLCNSDQPTKLRRPSSCGIGLSLDLNLAVGTEDESGESSPNSSDITTEVEHVEGRLAIKCSPSSSAAELVELVDGAIMFKPVDFAPLRRNVLESISKKLATVTGNGCSIKVDEAAVDRIVGGVWLGGAAFDEWAERVLTPSLKQLKYKLRADDDSAIVRLSVVEGGKAKTKSHRDWLPATVAIEVDRL